MSRVTIILLNSESIRQYCERGNEWVPCYYLNHLLPLGASECQLKGTLYSYICSFSVSRDVLLYSFIILPKSYLMPATPHWLSLFPFLHIYESTTIVYPLCYHNLKYGATMCCTLFSLQCYSIQTCNCNNKHCFCKV